MGTNSLGGAGNGSTSPTSAVSSPKSLLVFSVCFHFHCTCRKVSYACVNSHLFILFGFVTGTREQAWQGTFLFFQSHTIEAKADLQQLRLVSTRCIDRRILYSARRRDSNLENRWVLLDVILVEHRQGSGGCMKRQEACATHLIFGCGSRRFQLSCAPRALAARVHHMLSRSGSLFLNRCSVEVGVVKLEMIILGKRVVVKDFFGGTDFRREGSSV